MAMALKITEMFAFIIKDEDGNEGITAFLNNGMMTPMVGADMARVEDLKLIAEDIAIATGQEVKLVKFTKQLKDQSQSCHWKIADGDYDYYETECDSPFQLSGGTPEENNMKYCPSCGRLIKVENQ